MFKNIFEKIASGLMIGFGFALAIAAILFALNYYSTTSTHRVTDQSFDENSDLVIESHHSQDKAFGSVFVGTLKNKGTDSWSNVQIEVELFDDKNKFLDKCNEYDMATIAPGSSHNFKVTCDSCNPLADANFDHYKIKIIGANIIRPE